MNNYYYETKTFKDHFKAETDAKAIKRFKWFRYVKLYKLENNGKDKILIFKKKE